MKSARPLLAAAAMAAIITGLATSGLAQQISYITLDENGNGFYTHGTISERLNYDLREDPLSKIITLHYQLPFAGFTDPPGAVVLLELGLGFIPGTVSAQVSVINLEGHSPFMRFRAPTTRATRLRSG